MAKKGNMNIDNEDFEFDDEMFPLDDSVYDDDDDLAGFKFDPNEEGPTGAKGFFVNTMKSIKGIGVDFIDEFLPEAASISDDIKMAISDSKDQLLEKKDKAVNAFIDFKSNLSSKVNKESTGEVKKGFKKIADDFKKGKFYTSNRDVSIDMDAFLGEDEEDDSEESGEQGEVDTSGIMTTKFNYKAPRRRRQSSPIIVNNDGNSQVFIEAQEASTAAVASINTRLAKAQIRNSNQNFSDSISILKSIDDNLYGLSKFLTHYGKTNIDAQLEYDSKSLAFLTDQRALLKDILKANNASIGIKEKDENEEEEEDTSVFKFGSFNFDNYTKKIKENAKNMFMGTQLGQVIDMSSGMTSMFGKDSGMKLNPMDIAKNMAKSFVMNKMVSADTKNKLDRLNDMYGNIGGALMSTANRWKRSDNKFLSFLGELMGTEEGINKYVNLNKENLQDQTVFDVMTKETINETIPGYLAQITAALTGGKLTYYNHESKQFEERDSIDKKYKQIQEDAINTNFKFTSAINDIFDKSKENNKENLTVEEISKAVDLFKKNLIQSKSALDIFRLTHEGGDPEYKEKLFRGFETISKNNSEKLKDLVSEQIASLKPEQIADINTSINKVASDIETTAKDFKTKMAKIGGLTAIAEINDKERWEESDYNKRYSSLYNADLVKSNEFAKRRATMNKLELERSEFGERVGKVNLSTQASDLTNGASNKINDIYNLLLNGIKVYPSEDEKGLKKISSLRNKYDENERNKKQKEKEDYKNELKFKEMSSQARIEAEYTRKLNEQALRFKNSDNDSLLGQLREASGIDRFINKFINIAETPMNLVYGKEATANLVNDGAYGNVLLGDAKKLYEERLEKEKRDKEARKKQKIEKRNLRKKAGKQTFFDRVSESIEDLKESASGKLTEVKNKISTHNAKAELKRAKEAEKNKNKPTIFRKFLSTLDSEAIEKWNNTLLETSGSAKTKVFVDPEWLSSLSNDSKVKNKFYDIVIKNRAYITTDPQDSDIDVAFYAKKNMEQNELNLFHKRDVFEITANGKNLDLLDKYTGSSGTGKSALKRSKTDRILKNSEISDYSERDTNLNRQSVVKFDINAKNKNYQHDISGKKDIENAKNKLNNFNKKHDINSEKYKKLSEDEKKEIEKKRKELFDNVNNAIVKQNDNKNKDLGFKYKYITKINSPKTAGEMFLKPATQQEIDELLSSNDKKAIFDFAKKIQNKSKKEKKLKTQNELIEYLDPIFKNRVTEFLADPMLQGKGIKLKESVRSPLLQFALYSKGRVSPDITNDLMRAAGYEEGINYFPKEIRNKMGTDGITVRSLASNHLTGRSFDIESNGSASWKELNRIAASHGIRWAGEKDKPHFEFDEKYNGPRPYTKETADKIEKAKIQSIPKDGSMLKTDYINKIQNEENKNDLKISGKPISYYQNDPADTIVTGRPIIGKSVTVGKIEKLKTNKDILMGIYSNTQRIADNTEKIGFRFGIPGKVGTGLIGKVGDTIKTLSNKLIDGSKFLFDKGFSLLNKGFDIAKTSFGKMKDFATAGVSKVKDIVFADLDKMSKDQIIIKYNLEQELNMSLDQIKKKYKKSDLIEIVNGLKKNKSILTKGKNFITKGIAEAKDVGSSLYNKAKDAILGKKEDVVEKAKEYLLDNKIVTSKRKLNKLSDKEIIELAVKNGFKETKGRVGGLLSNAYNTVTKGIEEAKDLGSNLYNKAKDIVLGKKEDIATKAKEFILEKKLLAKEELDKLSENEIIKLAKENGFKEIKGRVGGLITAASNIGNKIINRATSGEGSLISIGGGVHKSGKILSKMDDIIEAIYLANGKEVPEEYKNREKSSITKKGKSAISKIKSKLDDVKSRKIIQQYGFEERLNMTEDNILEIYSYEDLKKFKTAIDRGEKLDKPKTPKESKIKELPGKIKTTVSKAAAAGKQKLSNLKNKVNEKKSRKIIQQYGFEERLNMTEDNILEIYSYEDLKKFKTAIDRGEKLDKPKTPKESKIKELPGKIKTTVSKAAAAGKQKLGKAIVDLSEKRIRSLINKYNLPELLDSTEDEIFETFTPEEIMDYVNDQRKEKLESMKEKLKAKLGNIYTGAKRIGKGLFGDAKKLAKGALGLGGKLVKGAGNFANNLLKGSGTGEGGLFSGLGSLANRAAKGLGELGSNVIKGGSDILSSFTGGIGKIFDDGKAEFRATLLAKLDKIDADILGVPYTPGTESVATKVTPSSEEKTNETKPKNKKNFIERISEKAKELTKPFKNEENIDKNTNEIEGSYKDQKSDKERNEEKENIGSIAKNIAGIATVLGTPQAIAAVGKESVQPENTIGSLLKANYENAELQNDLLEDIKQTSAETAKKAGKGSGGLGGWGKVGSVGAKLVKGINVAGGLATVGAAAAGAGMLIKQVFNKRKTMKQDAEHSTLLEKIGSRFGASGAGNYDAEGNAIDDQGKAGRSFGLNQLVHIGTFAKGVSKIGSIFAKFSGLVSKLFTNPKIVAKIGGKEAAANVSKAFLKEMGKATAKPGVLSKISSKITEFCGKVSQPIGWTVLVAQLIYDIGTGMAEANRYFKMGKGMKPTWPMRITAGLAKAISGNLTFGLIPPATIANFVFNIIGDKAAKAQMEEAKQFDMKRAALMEVEYDRLVEFESMTWSEIVFGGDKKRATILGFLKYDKKNKRKNEDSINKFKNWFEKVYQPLDQMYKDMVKKYGGKVDKKINPDDVAALENRDQFRKEYLEAAKSYINSNKLQGLGPLGKDKNLEEKEEDKDKEKQEQSVEEKEEKQMEKTSEDSSAQLSSEGLDVKGVASSSPALTASLPKNDSELSSTSTPNNKIPVNEPKVSQTTGTITNKPEITKDAYGNPKRNKITQQTATVVGGKVVSGDMSQEDYEVKQRLMNLNLRGEIYKNNVPVKYKFDNANKIYIPDPQMLELVGASDKDIEKYMNENAYYDSNGYEVDKKTLQRKSKEAENAQADGINFKKLMNKNYISQWKQFAKDNIKKTNLYNSAIAARAGITGKFKKTKVGALMSKGFAKIKNIASNLIGGAKEKISNAANKVGSALFKVIKSPADAIASFVSNRKETEAEVSSMLNNKDSESSVLNLADKMKDSRAIGQQRSAANLSPEFAQRVEAFLKDPRVMNKGVSIREGYRSPLTQLAYYSKGRASNSITDKLMKKAGFKDGINFWSKSFQKPGDYITWTLASNHFNGTAVDLEPGSVGYDKLGQIASEYGIDWGGNWSTPDKPHFEIGSPNFKIPNTHVASTTSEAESQQADTINYDRMLNYSNKAKDTISNSRIIGNVSKVTKSGLLGHLNKSASNTSVSRLNYNVKNNVSKVNANSSANKQDKSVVVSNLIEGKFDELLKISTEGVDIMRDLLDETKRHNKKEEEMMMNLIKGIAGLGAIMAASQNGGYSSAGNNNSITKGIFDNLAKGL